MEIRPHSEQTKKLKQLHLREFLIVMVTTVVIPSLLGLHILASWLFLSDVLLLILIISWKMRSCQCPQCGQTLTLPWSIRKNRSGGTWEYECKPCDILWTVDLKIV